MINKLQPYLTFIDEAVTSIQFPNNPERLYQPMKYILALGGKRVRPVLTLMACELFQNDYVKAKNAALAIECFHNFSLVHDDIMDKAPLRRGESTVHTKWDNNIAILSGDALLIEAYKLLSTYEPQLSQKLLNVFNSTATEVCEGQQMDMDFEIEKFVSIDHYLKMIELKTAVLLGCSLKLGAIIGGADNRSANDLYQFGLNLGIAFQLQDDILDVYAEQAKFGKQVGGDIIANKKTYLLLTAFEDSNVQQRAKLETLLNESNLEVKVKEIMGIYESLNVRKKVEERMNGFYEVALDNLVQLDLPETKKAQLKNLASFLMNRES